MPRTGHRIIFVGYRVDFELEDLSVSIRDTHLKQIVRNGVRDRKHEPGILDGASPRFVSYTPPSPPHVKPFLYTHLLITFKV